MQRIAKFGKDEEEMLFQARENDMRHLLLAQLIALAGLLPAYSADRADESKRQTPAEKYEGLVDAARGAQEAFQDAYRAAATDEERRKILEERGRKASPQAHAAGFFKLIKRHPDDPVALDALNWLFSRDPHGSFTRKAVDAISPKLIESRQIASLCQSLRHSPSPAGERLLRKVIEVNRHREVQGYARYSLAQFYKNRSERIALAQDRRDQTAKKADKLLAEVSAQYADLELGSQNLRARAKAELFELRHLAIGKAAPEIVGEDLDGKPLKLSDHRGKVVLLVFSGFSWCGACRAQLPREKELVDRLKGKPFVLLGIYREKDREWLRQFVKEQGITWRAWWDGTKAPGPITRKWSVDSWPTMYLLDADGVIRYKGKYLRATTLRKDRAGSWRPVRLLDEAVDTLLDELSAAP